MTGKVTDTALLKFLKKKNSDYFAKLGELRDELSGWLSYIPHTFPHYTRHTIEHSEEIILQLSRLLFSEEDPKRPIVNLSPVECFILAASAYLHDAGMVTSDNEKTQILSSDKWKDWTTGEGGGAKRLKEINLFRQGCEPEDPSVRNFLADIQIRFLVAEFVRVRHHLRAANVIHQHQSTLGRFAFNDPQLEHAISHVCVGHGLDKHELLDSGNYPERRNIRGESVNLRFMAILLRLGDLLDMSCDRACPLLMNAASPLPPDSLAHWTQYRRLVHQLTAPDLIEISAECENQNEHRVLQDWCQWIVDEVNNASIVMGSAKRHGNWKAPVALISGPKKTIKISPSKTANYIPSNWVLKLDRDIIMQRLVYDIHGNSKLFILELIQNSLDATRNQLYRDLQSKNLDIPESPTKFPEEIRARYPVQIQLEEVSLVNELSGESERKQKFTIEDFGTGMSRKIIEKYFLQIGRSYYSSDEFRRNSSFHPISRFGVGFLSVFAVSDFIQVETYHAEPPNNSDSIKITLTGPSSYLLSEKGERKTHGTKIEVLLREPLHNGELTKSIREWCKKVEFPIIINELGSMQTIGAEQPEHFIHESPVLTEESSTFAIRSFEIDSNHIEGHLYLLAMLTEEGERWDKGSWAKNSYPSTHPGAVAPFNIGNSFCFHGIERAYGYVEFKETMATRVDYRGLVGQESMSRQPQRWELRGAPYHADCRKQISDKWQEIVTHHLSSSPFAKGKNSWAYKNRLADDFPLGLFWESEPGMFPISVRGRHQLVDFTFIHKLETLRIVKPISSYHRNLLNKVEKQCGPNTFKHTDTPTITTQDLRRLNTGLLKRVFENRYVSKLITSPDNDLEIYWENGENPKVLKSNRHIISLIETVEFSDDSIIGSVLHKAVNEVRQHVFLNLRNPFVTWLLQLDAKASTDSDKQLQKAISTVFELLDTPLRYNGYQIEKLKAYLDLWKELPDFEHENPPSEISSWMKPFSLKSKSELREKEVLRNPDLFPGSD